LYLSNTEFMYEYIRIDLEQFIPGNVIIDSGGKV